ncbi:helix-turn-helix transcriptional regulator [Paracoccus sp. pheM1]|nr:helix-turn-helix transcriptional regulator [Paracoccus sp. pheM1]MBT0778036.1 helix-turn-helix transcriptional regulator [Paracoccus sp. pheM1]
MTMLEHHLRASEETQAQFASRIGVRQGTVSKLMRGLVTPSLKLAQRIERVTNGAVPVSSWVDPDPADTWDAQLPQPAATAAQPQEHPYVPDLQNP